MLTPHVQNLQNLRTRLGALGLALALGGACKKEQEMSDDVAGPPASDADDDDSKTPADGSGGRESAPDPSTDSRKRTGGLAGIAVGLVSDAKDAAKRPLTVIPADVEFVFSVDVQPLMAMTAMATMRDLMLQQATKDEGKGEVLDRARECGLDIAKMQMVTLAGKDSHSVGVIRGTGYGKPEAYECLAKWMKTTPDPEPLEVLEIDGTKVLVSEEDRGYFLDDDTILMVDKELLDAVDRLRKGEGKAVTDGDLGPTIAKVEQEEQAWLAMRGGPDSAFSSPDVADVTAAWGTMHYDEKLVTTFSMQSATADGAEKAHKVLQEGIDQAKQMTSMLGIPATVHTGLELKRDGEVITLTSTMSQADLEGVSNAFKTFMH
jgi:hypothetical protein